MYEPDKMGDETDNSAVEPTRVPCPLHLLFCPLQLLICPARLLFPMNLRCHYIPLQKNE